MLVASDLKDVMITASEGKTVATEAMIAFGNAIANYLLTNAELDFSWHGQMVNPSPPPPVLDDPVTSAHGGIVSLTITLTPSGATDSASGMSYLANEIRTGFLSGQFNITDGGFATTPMPMNDCPPLSLSMSGETVRDTAHLNLATQIVNWVKSYKPAGIILGSHSTYTAPTGTGGLAIVNFY